MEECRNLVAKVRESGDRRLLGEVQFKTCHPLFNSSRHREAKRSADEGFAILLEGYEENPYLNLNFQIYEHLVGLCHLFLGEWADALRNVTHRIEICEKNGDHLSAIANGAMRPRVQIHAMDFAGAQQFLESALPLLMPVPVAYRQNLIFAGLAEAGLGSHERALEYLLKCREEMDQRPMMPDWYDRMPLQQALTEAWLSKGGLEKARLEAEKFLKVTLATEERTFRALAFEVNARIAIAEHNLDRAQDFIAKASQAMEGFEVLLAHWRVHATASEIHRCLGDRDLADSHRELSRVTIMKLADSLPAEDPLRQTFLSAPLVRKVFDDVQVGTTMLRRKKLDRVTQRRPASRPTPG